jgi:ATP-dependent Clp protease ATP-binding subunit ClpA
MFDAFSMRARQIVFAARFKAGARGANLIEVEDFLLGLVLEDQGMLGQSVFSKLHDGQGTLLNKAPSHTPFFTQEVAKNLVTRINELLPQMEPLGPSTEIPLSPALERAFGSAKAFQDQFPYGPVEPLHLLVAILTEESGHSAKLLKEFGITTEKAMEQLGGTGGN